MTKRGTLRFVKLFLKPPVLTALKAAHGLLISEDGKGYQPRGGVASQFKQVALEGYATFVEAHRGKISKKEAVYLHKAIDIAAYIMDEDDAYQQIFENAMKAWHEASCKYVMKR